MARTDPFRASVLYFAEASDRIRRRGDFEPKRRRDVRMAAANHQARHLPLTRARAVVADRVERQLELARQETRERHDGLDHGLVDDEDVIPFHVLRQWVLAGGTLPSNRR